MSLKELLVKEFEPVAKAVDAFPWDNEEKYANYLAQTFYYTNHSTRLLAVGAGRIGFDEESLHQRYFQHGVEEKGHQVMAKNDMEKLGYSLDQFTEMNCTKQLYQPHYYYMHHADPAALFGYILALEGGAWIKAEDMFKMASEAHGVQKAVFLKVHASHDPKHIDEALEFVEKMKGERLELIMSVFQQTLYAMEEFFHSVAQVETKLFSKAA